MADRLATILEGFRQALRREVLPPAATPAPPRVPAGSGLIQVIFAREPLEEHPPATPASRRGFFSLLFGREQIGHWAPPPARPRSRWLAWLFGAERLDD